MAKKENISELREKLQEIYHLGSALQVLHWDMEVFMPAKGSASRAATIANLSGILHEKFTSKEFAALLQKAKAHLDAGKLDDEESAIVRELWREYDRQKEIASGLCERNVAGLLRRAQCLDQGERKIGFQDISACPQKNSRAQKKRSAIGGFQKIAV